MAKKARTGSKLLRRLKAHFRCDPAKLPVVEQLFEAYERPNVFLAIEEMLRPAARATSLIGVVGLYDDYHVPSLAKLARPAAAQYFDEGPVEYIDAAMPGDRNLACVKQGLYLFRDEKQPLALLVTPRPQTYPPKLGAAVMASDREHAERFLRDLVRQTHLGKAFRGHILSIDLDCHGGITLNFHRLPAIARQQIILPEPLLRRLERQTLVFNEHVDRLKAAGRHLKRGLLLHGPPGTGKTLSAMYLVAQMPGRTVLLITGGSLNALETACRLARMLQPTTVVLEDVDLIGTERQHQSVGANALLFELLNQMDGLAEDTDILFVLTTNRPDILEPALASRPGRIDQAIEIPPPDLDCRRRLFELYARGMQVEVEDLDRFLTRTEGVSGAFIKELLRKAAVFAAAENGTDPLTVQDRHLEEALAELLVAGGALTQSLLGGRATSAVHANT
jgi:hypothetical protein